MQEMGILFFKVFYFLAGWKDMLLEPAFQTFFYKIVVDKNHRTSKHTTFIVLSLN